VRLSRDEALHRLRVARVARLATVSADGQPHLVPVTFAIRDEVIVIAVDHKPKSTRNLKRLSNIQANPRVSVLADEYNEDWTQLWWARADGTAEISGRSDPLLAEKYQQYKENPPQGPFIRIHITTVTGWTYT
jgi:PPOX class probable F420-dependent enzyme